MENDGMASRAQIACKCDRWPERLLQQGCLHDRCHRCDANSFDALGNDNRYTGARSRWDTAAVCTACDDAMKQSGDCANDKTLTGEKPFHVGSPIVPRTLEGLLACELCIDQLTAVPQREAAYFCKDCNVNLLCYECKQSHDNLCGEKHSVMPIDENEEQKLAVHPWARIPAVRCRLHDSPCNRWCCKCDTAKCKVCALQCAKGFHAIYCSDELNLDSWVGQLNSSTYEIEKACTQFRHVESALELEHRADMLELKKRKLRVLVALDSAFSAAREALESSFRETRRRVANFRNCIDSAVHCSRLLTRQPLPSHSILIQCAQRAVDSHKYAAQRLLAREEAILVRLGSTTLADDLADVMKGWIGLPAELQMPGPCKIEQSTFLADNVFRAQPQLICYDIASTLCGHVLVAAGKSGLQELDSRGCLLDTWLPMSASASTGTYNHLTVNEGKDLELVVSVDCLEDDRAVVGLQNACAVVLLKRECNGNGGSLEWHEHQRFYLGQEAPFGVATGHNLLLVALGSVNKDSQILLPGKQLAAFDVNTGIRQASGDLDFEIDSLAVSAQKVVIVASHYRVNVIPACNGKFVIEARNSDLQSCIWRVTRDQPVLGLAASASGAVVYASVARERGRRVITLDVNTGLVAKVALADICIGVPSEVRAFRNLEIKSCNKSRRSNNSNAADSAANITYAVGRTDISTSNGTQDEHWFTLNGKLVALGFDSRTKLLLPSDFVQPSLRDSQRRAMYLAKKFLTTILYLVSGLVSAFVIGLFISSVIGFLLHPLQAIVTDSEKLLRVVVTLFVIRFHLAQLGQVNNSAKISLDFLLADVKKVLKFLSIQRV